MTKQDFIQYLSYPEKLNGHSIDILEKLVQEYPYFQIGRMLYLKNLHNENNIDYEKNLHITSAYAPGGKALYTLIKKKSSLINSSEEDKKQKLKTYEEAVGISNQLPIVDIEIKKEILPKLEAVAILREMAISINKEDLSDGKEEKQDTSDELQVLEKQMLREAYRTSMTVDLLEKKGLSEKGKSEKEGPSTIITHHPSSISQSYSFGDWLKVITQKTPAVTKHALNTNEEIRITKKSKTEIIDNFILEETTRSAPKPKAAFFSAEVMAKKSILDDENFISETLAKIYLKQGNLPKAKRAYEILLVKHPEKVHIFAPLLEKIKELIKQQSPSRPSQREGGK